MKSPETKPFKPYFAALGLNLHQKNAFCVEKNEK
jgi:hypothetical protein